MQPRCRHVPPSFASRSTTATFNPRAPARAAAMYPPGPEPITTTSYSSPVDGAGFGEGAVAVAVEVVVAAGFGAGAADAAAGFSPAAPTKPSTVPTATVFPSTTS